MESLKEKIEKFLSCNDCKNYGSGECSDCNDGRGYGYGKSNDYSNGSGYGDGYGRGRGDIDGNGYGSGIIDGKGAGYGDGSGYGEGILTFNGENVYLIDNIQTIITHVVKNVAKGFILRSDFTLKPCYIVKGNKFFAHGKTIKKAMEDLQEKIFEGMDTEEAIEKFREKFKKGERYKGSEFYTWHHYLTNSCEMGRDNFVKENSINLDDTFTVLEFIELTENSYGGEIIKQLKEYYCNL